MLADTNLTRNFRFKTGWIILLVLAALMALNHLSLIFFRSVTLKGVAF